MTTLTSQSDCAIDALKALVRHRIPYCVLRDASEVVGITETRSGEIVEVDLLVAEHDLARVEAVLTGREFVPLRSWGHRPHHFFVAYIKEDDYWLKLDVVTSIAFGKTVRSLETCLGESCLSRRRQLDGISVLSPEDEFLTLLLHCALDKGRFDERHQLRLTALTDQVTDPDYLDQKIQKYWLPERSWDALRKTVNQERWKDLLEEAPRLTQKLFRAQPVKSGCRWLHDRFMRKLDRFVQVFRPLGPTVAVLAPDGAGKSTVVAQIEQNFFFGTRTIYMGLYQKTQPRGRGRVPGIGLAGKLLCQWRNYLLGRYHRARGRLVIFDRYPYDALLPTAKPMSALRRLRRYLLAYSCPAPTLTVVLDAPGEILYRRSGEHSPEALEQQRQGYLVSQQRLPRTVVIDATRDADAVCRSVTAEVWRCYGRRLQRRKPL